MFEPVQTQTSTYLGLDLFAIIYLLHLDFVVKVIITIAFLFNYNFIGGMCRFFTGG